MYRHMNNAEKNSYVKNKMLTTLLELIDKQTFEDISISQLVGEAGVGRASFYRNYNSKEDVLRQEAARLMEEYQNLYQNDDPQNMTVKIIHLLDFYKEHSEFYCALYKAGLSNIIQDTFISSAEITDELPNTVAYVKSAFAYLTYGWIIEWIKRGMQESGTELAAMFTVMEHMK